MPLRRSALRGGRRCRASRIGIPWRRVGTKEIRGNSYILARLDDLARRRQGSRPQIVEKVRSHYHYRCWHDSVRARIDSTTGQFAEFVTTMQE